MDNKTPVAGDYTTSEYDDGVVTGNVAVTDSDDNDLSYEVTTAPHHGTVTIDDDGNYVYTLDDDSDLESTGGTDTFVVTASDRGAFHLHGLIGLFRPDLHETSTMVTITIPKTEQAEAVTAEIRGTATGAPTRGVDGVLYQPSVDATGAHWLNIVAPNGSTTVDDIEGFSTAAVQFTESGLPYLISRSLSPTDPNVIGATHVTVLDDPDSPRVYDPPPGQVIALGNGEDGTLVVLSADPTTTIIHHNVLHPDGSVTRTVMPVIEGSAPQRSVGPDGTTYLAYGTQEGSVVRSSPRTGSSRT